MYKINTKESLRQDYSTVSKFPNYSMIFSLRSFVEKITICFKQKCNIQFSYLIVYEQTHTNQTYFFTCTYSITLLPWYVNWYVNMLIIHLIFITIRYHGCTTVIFAKGAPVLSCLLLSLPAHVCNNESI